MKHLFRMPLYLGFSVFVFAVMVSLIKVGEQTSFPKLQSQASEDYVKLNLLYTQPNIISVQLNSEKIVSGLDVYISYDDSLIDLQPSSLQAGQNYIITGGKIEKPGVFRFSAINKSIEKFSGVVAFFTFRQKNVNAKTKTVLKILEGAEKSVVIGKSSGESIPVKVQDLRIEI